MRYDNNFERKWKDLENIYIDFQIGWRWQLRVTISELILSFLFLVYVILYIYYFVWEFSREYCHLLSEEGERSNFEGKWSIHVCIC